MGDQGRLFSVPADASTSSSDTPLGQAVTLRVHDCQKGAGGNLFVHSATVESGEARVGLRVSLLRENHMACALSQEDCPRGKGKLLVFGRQTWNSDLSSSPKPASAAWLMSIWLSWVCGSFLPSAFGQLGEANAGETSLPSATAWTLDGRHLEKADRHRIPDQ